MSQPDYLPWAGFAPLRKGRVHVWCPKCKRKLSNMPRQTFDPERATLVHSFCIRCSEGCKDTPEWYYDANGKQIEWEEIEAQIDAQIKAGRADA
jgi:hypothetical protein